MSNNKDINIKPIGNNIFPYEMPQQQINKQLGMPSTGNKALYIVIVEDPSSKPKLRVYGTAKPEKTQSFLEFIGYDLTINTTAQIEQLKTYEDVIELSNQGKTDLVSLVYPWSRVISIKNVSYKIKSASK